jgi:hypothetical protein
MSANKPETQNITEPFGQPQRVDAAATHERVITLATSADRHRLRGELLKLIIKNEARRKGVTSVLANQDLSTTDGSANSRIVEALSS